MIEARRVEYSVAATRTLQKIDRTTSKRIRQKIKQLANNPAALSNNITPLKGEKGLKRLRVGDWRVIYSETLVVLTVVRVASRGSIYE